MKHFIQPYNNRVKKLVKDIVNQGSQDLRRCAISSFFNSSCCNDESTISKQKEILNQHQKGLEIAEQLLQHQKKQNKIHHDKINCNPKEKQKEEKYLNLLQTNKDKRKEENYDKFNIQFCQSILNGTKTYTSGQDMETDMKVFKRTYYKKGEPIITPEGIELTKNFFKDCKYKNARREWEWILSKKYGTFQELIRSFLYREQQKFEKATNISDQDAVHSSRQYRDTATTGPSSPSSSFHETFPTKSAPRPMERQFSSPYSFSFEKKRKRDDEKNKKLLILAKNEEVQIENEEETELQHKKKEKQLLQKYLIIIQIITIYKMI